jgi:hypothetical protein
LGGISTFILGVPHPPFGDPERYPFVAQSIDKALADLVADDPLRVDVAG